MKQVHKGEGAVDAALQALYKALIAGMHHGRLFVSDNANVWGAAPESALPDDEIFVLMGCSVPVVLRKLTDREYRLVGECFCYGYMDGEAWRTSEGKELDVQEIVLR
jgi:hypothetical protein